MCLYKRGGSESSFIVIIVIICVFSVRELHILDFRPLSLGAHHSPPDFIYRLEAGVIKCKAGDRSREGDNLPVRLYPSGIRPVRILVV